jgi:hypothetical protein
MIELFLYSCLTIAFVLVVGAYFVLRQDPETFRRELWM